MSNIRPTSSVCSGCCTRSLRWLCHWCPGGWRAPTSSESSLYLRAYLGHTAHVWTLNCCDWNVSYTSTDHTVGFCATTLFLCLDPLGNRMDVTPPNISLPYWRPLLVRMTCIAGFSPCAHEKSMSTAVTERNMLLGPPVVQAAAIIYYSK